MFAHGQTWRWRAAQAVLRGAAVLLSPVILPVLRRVWGLIKARFTRPAGDGAHWQT